MPKALPCPVPLPEPKPGADIEALLDRAKHFATQGITTKHLLVTLNSCGACQHTRWHCMSWGVLPIDAVTVPRREPHMSSLSATTRWTQLDGVNLGTLLYDDGDLHGARLQFEAALGIDGALRDPHRGLARIAQDLGDIKAADAHWRQSFNGQAIATQPCRGQNPPAPLLMLVSTSGGNIPTQYILDDRIHAITVLYAEYYRPDLPLPPHSLIFNTIGDADRCTQALEMGETIVARSGKPVINHPAKVRKTARAINAQRLSGVAGVRAPTMRQFRRNQTNKLSGLTFPLLLRAPGFHTGQHFLKVQSKEQLTQAITTLPGDELLAIEFLDARGSDGLVRKYRTMYIGGAFYPLHLAISMDWKVHYFSADMQISDAHRAEEQHFLENMPDVLGAQAMDALNKIGEIMGLEYAGIDFALDSDGLLLLFEANATMLINPPGPEPIWDYRRNPSARALKAAQKLLARE